MGGWCPKEHSHGRSSCQGSIRPGLLPSSLPFAPPSSIPASVFPPLPTPPLPVFSQPRVARTRETTSPTKLNPKCANKTTTNAPPMVKTHRKPGGSLSLEQLHGCWQRPSRPPAAGSVSLPLPRGAGPGGCFLEAWQEGQASCFLNGRPEGLRPSSPPLKDAGWVQPGTASAAWLCGAALRSCLRAASLSSRLPSAEASWAPHHGPRTARTSSAEEK